MDVGDFLKSLVIDTWYKAIMCLSGVVLGISFFLDVKGISNAELQLLAGGAFLIGLGEWKNAKVASWIKPPNAYTGPAALVSQHVRKPDVLGIAMDLLGVVLILIGVWKVMFD